MKVSLSIPFADFERAWGGLVRWSISAAFVFAVWCVLSFGNQHYVSRAEFSQIREKLDSLSYIVTQDSIRLQDVQERLHRIEGRQDGTRGQQTSVGLRGIVVK